MEKNNTVKERFPNLANACQKTPTIQLHPNSHATIYQETKIRAKNGFIDKFCKD